jgi:hypothetical protein
VRAHPCKTCPIIPPVVAWRTLHQHNVGLNTYPYKGAIFPALGNNRPERPRRGQCGRRHRDRIRRAARQRKSLRGMLIGENVSTTAHERIMQLDEYFLPRQEVEAELDELHRSLELVHTPRPPNRRTASSRVRRRATDGNPTNRRGKGQGSWIDGRHCRGVQESRRALPGTRIPSHGTSMSVL